MVHIGVYNLNKDSTVKSLAAKYVFDAGHKIQRLQSIAELMDQKGYDKKLVKFTKKRDKLQKKHSAACEQVQRVGGTPNGHFFSPTDLLSNIEKHDEAMKSDSKVAKTKRKLDEFLAKNQLYYESQFYQGGTHVSVASFSLSVSSGGKNIQETITDIKDQEQKALATVFGDVKKKITELLKKGSVGVMALGESGSEMPTDSTKIVALDKLTLDDLMNLKNGEMCVVNAPVKSAKPDKSK